MKTLKMLERTYEKYYRPYWISFNSASRYSAMDTRAMILLE
jgi:hypothetical protein